MLSPRWHKVFRDVFGNKTRTVLVVLSIAVGVFAVGIILGGRVVVSRELNAGYAAVNPAHATLYTAAFQDDLLDVVRRVPGVEEAEGQLVFSVRVGDESENWRTGVMRAIPRDGLRLNTVSSETGAWPPPDKAVLVERSSASLIHVQAGQTLMIELPDGRQREIPVAGIVHDVSQAPAFMTGQANLYVSRATLEWLGLSDLYNQLNIRVAGHPTQASDIEPVLDAVRTKVEKAGNQVFGSYIPRPGRHPAEDFLQPTMLIMGVIGLFALLLAAFLIINTLSAVLAQHTRQIGIMKAVGARRGQIALLYIAMVLVYGAMALVVAIPLGFLATRWLSGMVARLVNFDINNYSVPGYVYVVEVLVGLIVPVVAALIPIRRGTRTTVHDALNDYGIGKNGFGSGMLDRVLESIRGLSRPTLLSLRNTFRKKGRLALTLLTLTLAGAIFIGVFSVRASLLTTLDDALQYFNYDIDVSLGRAYRIEQIENVARSIPGVQDVESWGYQSLRRLHDDGTDGATVFMMALPARTGLLNPMLVDGRWLLPQDENAVVVNTEVLKEEPDIGVGDTIALKTDDRELSWVVVGIVKGVFTGPNVYSNYPYFASSLGTVGRAHSLQVVTKQHDLAAQTQLARQLEDRLEAAGIQVRNVQTIGELRATIETQFNLIIAFLLGMSVLLAVVGGLGLMGTMSINVLERTREIAVMRAIGATPGAVMRLVIFEGVVVGLISWIIGGLAAVPISRLLSAAVGMSMLRTNLAYTFSGAGALIWLVIVVVLAGLAGTLPGFNAARQSVRDTLAYE